MESNLTFPYTRKQGHEEENLCEDRETPLERQPREPGSRDLSTAPTNQGTPGTANLHRGLGEEKGQETPSGRITATKTPLFS